MGVGGRVGDRVGGDWKGRSRLQLLAITEHKRSH